MFGNAGAFCKASGYVPLFNGTITSFNVYTGSTGSASNIQVCLYLGAVGPTGGGTLLATSSTVGAGNANSLINLPVTPIAVTTGNTYSLMVSCSAGQIASGVNSGSNAFQCTQYNSTHFPFAAPPATGFNPRDAATGHEAIIWADAAAVGPTAYSLIAAPGTYNYSLGSSSSGYSVGAAAGIYGYAGGAASLIWSGAPHNTGPAPSSLKHWIPFDFACRLNCLQRGTLNVGNTRQNKANLQTLAIAQANAPSSPQWAKWSTAANSPKKLLIIPYNVPGFIAPTVGGP